MPSPRVFISSTYVDLVDARSVVEHYFRELLYEPIAFERGGMHFDHTKPLDISGYEAVKDCDLMILIIGGRYGTPSSKQLNPHNKSNFNSITKTEYLEALSAGIPIFTFIKQNVYNEFFTFINQPKKQRKNFIPKFVDNVLVFQLVKEIRDFKTNNLIIEYESVSEILQYLKKATANLVHDAIKTRKEEIETEDVAVNGYKLFYYRRKKGYSHTELSKITEINRSHLISLEIVRSPEATTKHGSIFRKSTKSIIAKLEAILECRGQLCAGNEDDLLSMFIQYYHSNKGKPTIKAYSNSQIQQTLFPIKSIVFDFDGTLTKQNSRTTWELVWEELGYNIEDCAKLHRDFSNKVINHNQWCERTCEAFNNRLITEQTLEKVASKIELLSGVPELLQILKDNKIEMHILSGSILQIINNVLGPLAKYFTHIQANSFKFAGQTLSYIQGTDYDFEGKATYITGLMDIKHFSPTDLLFVGNSSNDKYVSRSGVATLCVNPHFTDGNDEKEWLYCIREMHDIREILKFINL